MTVFLCHSHKDKTLVEGLINLLASQFRMMLYFDWLDSTMPRVTSHVTALKIKNQIGDLNLFMILATKNAMESHWVPWEIGLAEVIKPNDKIVLIPVSDSTGKFFGSEYLQLYQTIQLSVDKKYSVFKPNETSGVTLDFAFK